MLTNKTIALWIAMLGMTLASCSREDTPPTRLAIVPGTPDVGVAGAFNLYVPGSIMDSYMTLELKTDSDNAVPLSIGRCSWVAAKMTANEVEVVLFQADANLRSRTATEGVAARSAPVDIVVKLVDRPATVEELARLTSDGFTTLKCAF